MVLAVLTVATAVMLVAGLIVGYEKRRTEKKVRTWIRETYGKIPVGHTKDFVDISIYWKEEQISESETIDEITWNDLELDRVFDRINVTRSFAGEQMLYGKLHHQPVEKESLYELEKKIHYYQHHDKEREEMGVRLWRLGKEKIAYYLPMFMKNLDMQRVPHIWIYQVLQILLLLSTLTAVLTEHPVLVLLALGVFITNTVIYTLKKSQYELYMETLRSVIQLIRLTDGLIEKEEILPERVPDRIKEDVRKLKKITRMIVSLQRKKQAGMLGDIGGLVQDYLIGSTLWDFIQYDKVMSSLLGRQKEFMELYRFIGELDAAISVASFRTSLDLYCKPEFIRGKEVVMEEIFHPLVSAPVKNTLDMNRNILLTGSNASGKSTFIKAVAVNAALAQSIHTCMARKMLLPDVRVITSMAVRDDLLSKESYYIKEIGYLQRILADSEKERLVLCAIDEILRGTNTAERIAASTAVLEFLLTKNALVLVASHDLELAVKLSEEYDLYYFCEKLKEGDIVFDFKIRKGISNSRNAIRLLESVGFPGQIIRDARRLYMDRLQKNQSN